MINKIRNLEYDCVLESTETQNKFNLSFLRKYQESVLTGVATTLECDSLFKDNLKKFSMMLDESLEQLKNTKVNPEHLSTFFNKTYNSITMDQAPITIPVRKLTDVEKIRPQYLSQMISDVLGVCKKITNNEITHSTQLDQYINDEYCVRYKRQLVKTNIPINVGDKIDVLMNYGKPVLCEVNQEFFQTTCMPFLRSYNYNVKELGDTNNNIRNIITKEYANIINYIKTVDSLKTANKLSELQFSLLRQFLFNATNKFLELASFLVFMAVRRINDYTFNLNSFIYLYNEISRYYPEGDSILHESVLDGSFEDIDSADLVFELVRNNNSTMKIIAERILQKVKTNLSIRYGNDTGDLFHSVIDVNSESKDYDISVYDNINDMFVKVSSDLDTLKANMQDEFILVDDLMRKSNFDNTLSNRFMAIISSISNVECYTGVLNGDNGFNDSDVILTIINELNHFDENIDVITRNIHECYDEIREFTERLESNVNAEFSNDATRLEVVEKMKKLDIDFSDLVMLTSKAILERLHALSDICNHVEFRADKIHDHDGMDLDFENTENYAEMAMEFELESMNAEYMLATESMMSEFNNKLIEKKYGITFYESDQPTVVNNNSENEEKEEAAKAKENSNQTNNDTPENKMKAKTTIQDLITRAQTFFKTMTSKFNEMIKKQLGKNKKWLDENSEAILGRSVWTGIQINMPKNYYMDFRNLFSQTHATVKNNLNALTAEKINSFSNPDDLDRFIFSFVNKNTDVKSGIVNKFVYNGNSEKPITYSGNGAKQVASQMVEYCNNYYESDANDIAVELERFGDDCVNKVKSLNDIDPGTARHIVSMCQYYAGTILNTQRDRTYAYLKVLTKLVPRQKLLKKNKQETPTDTGNNPS